MILRMIGGPADGHTVDYHRALLPPIRCTLNFDDGRVAIYKLADVDEIYRPSPRYSFERDDTPAQLERELGIDGEGR